MVALTICNSSRRTRSVHICLHRFLGYWFASKQPQHLPSMSYSQHNRTLGCAYFGNPSKTNSSNFSTMASPATQEKLQEFFVDLLHFIFHDKTYHNTSLVSSDGIKKYLLYLGHDLLLDLPPTPPPPRLWQSVCPVLSSRPTGQPDNSGNVLKCTDIKNRVGTTGDM